MHTHSTCRHVHACTYASTCMHARTHTCMHASMHVCTHTRMHVCTHMYVCTPVHTAHTHAHMHAHTHACTHATTHAHTHARMHARTRALTRTHVHTHMHTHTLACTHAFTPDRVWLHTSPLTQQWWGPPWLWGLHHPFLAEQGCPMENRPQKQCLHKNMSTITLQLQSIITHYTVQSGIYAHTLITVNGKGVCAYSSDVEQ